MKPMQHTSTPDRATKVLEAFCTVAMHFEKDIHRIGATEVTHLIAVARTAAEEALKVHRAERSLLSGPPRARGKKALAPSDLGRQEK